MGWDISIQNISLRNQNILHYHCSVKIQKAQAGHAIHKFRPFVAELYVSADSIGRNKGDPSIKPTTV